MNITEFQLLSSATPSAGDHVSPLDPGTSQAHQRVYQACLPCRRRKVKCDMGSVDNPRDPPCSRCKRESKQCHFAPERRKKRKTGESAVSVELDEADDVYEISNGVRKRVKNAESHNHDQAIVHDERPRTPGGSLANDRPLKRPSTTKKIQYSKEAEKAAEQTAALLQRGEVHSGHDALHMLHAAAAYTQSKNVESDLHSSLSPTTGRSNAPSYQADLSLPDYHVNIARNADPAPFPRRVATSEPSSSVVTDLLTFKDFPQYAAAIKAWSRLKFVRNGWFTPDEGIQYILYFYRNLAPLTPVALPDFRQPETHKKMLEEEPTLSIAMLVTASRHMKLMGAGSHSRPHAIHDKLWKYLQGMIGRLTWGQEQFGGGFCGAGAGSQHAADVNPLSRRGMRALGSVEALIILTEWHPRAMHFPPDDDDIDLMLPDQETQDHGDVSGHGNMGAQRWDAWLEPYWRSDRVCWTLLGLALTLAFEIAIFDATDWERHATTAEGLPLSAAELRDYDKRRKHVRDLLLVYVTQTGGRLGLTSMLPDGYCSPEQAQLLYKPIDALDDPQSATLHFWLRMTKMIKEGNLRLFPTRETTRELTRTGRYKDVLIELQGPLDQWRRDFDACQQIPTVMRSVLLIEFYYDKAYINSLALQSVFEQWTRHAAESTATPLEMARSFSKSSHIALTPAQLSRYFGPEREIMSQAADSARKLLRIVVDDLARTDSLRYAPVRTYFRIISTAILLFKTMGLGAYENDMREGFMLLDRTIEALRTSVVDDVHVASRFAELLHNVSNNIKPSLRRMAADGGIKRSHQASPGSPRQLQASLNVPGTNGYQPHNVQHSSETETLPTSLWHANGNILASPAPLSATNQTFVGLPDDIYDLNANNKSLSIMPPPGFANLSPTQGGYETLASHANAMANGQDWFALPLDPAVANLGSDLDIIHTQWGPEVAGMDMFGLLGTDGSVSQDPSRFQGYEGYSMGGGHDFRS